MKILLLIALGLSCSFVLYAQLTAPPIQWQASLGGNGGDYGGDVQSTSDGGYVVAGTLDLPFITGHEIHAQGELFVTKFTVDGLIQWQKSYGGTYPDNAYSIEQTSDGGYIIAGQTASNNGDVSGNHGGQLQDYWIVKISSSGSLQWQKCLGGTNRDVAASIRQTIDGGYYVVGVSYSNDGDVSGNHGGQDGWVVRLNSSGGIIWQRCIGGSGWEDMQSVYATADGGCIVSGQSYSNDGDVLGNHQGGGLRGADNWVVKLNSLGNITWQKCLGGTYEEMGSSVIQTSDGGYIVAGFTSSTDGDVKGNHGQNGLGRDLWIVKLFNTGSIDWQKCLGGSIDDWGKSIHQTIEGGYVVGGHSYSNNGDLTLNHGLADYWIAKINNLGSLEWQKSFGGSDYDWGLGVAQDLAGGYALAGSSSSIDGDITNSLGDGDIWVVKLFPANTSTISFYNQAAPTAKSTLLNATDLANLNPPPIKICADGSRATYIEYTNKDTSVQLINIAFRILEDATAEKKDIYGFFDPPSNVNSSPETMKAFYHHPTYLDINAIYRADTVQVYDKSNNRILCNYPIQIYRAPLLMVHGLMGTRLSFRPFEDSLFSGGRNLYPGNSGFSPLTLRADYSATNTGSFEENKEVVKINVRRLLDIAVANSFSAGKVDIIAHSMGGILSRLYIQNPYGSVPYSDDVHKFITFNTPHSGTQFADWGTQTLCPAVSIALSFIFKDIASLTCPAFNYAFPAFADLGTNSEAIDNYLNGPTLRYTNRVPTSAITSISDFYNDPDCEWYEEGIAPTLNLFNGMPSDGIVPLVSQSGGIFPKHTPVANVCHIGAMNDPFEFYYCLELINEPPISQFFDTDGYIPLGLKYQPLILKDNAPVVSQSVHFTAPANLSVYKPGQQITITAQGSTEIKKMQVIIGDGIFDAVSFDTTGRSLSFNYTVPQKELGEMRMIVFGYDSLYNYVFDTLRIYTKTKIRLDSITVYPSRITMPAGANATVEVTGYFHDGYSRNISNLADVQYMVSDTTIAKHTVLNQLQGKKKDTTSVTISYLGLSKRIPVEVFDGADYQHAGFVTYDTLICRNQQVHFTNYTTGTPDSIRWMLTGATPATTIEQSPVVVYKKPGAYDARLICYYATKNDTLTLPQYVRVVNKVPAKPGKILITRGSNKVCAGDTVVYSINPISNASGYTWKVPVGASILDGQGTSTVTVLYSSAFLRNDSVSVAAINGCGTSLSAFSKVTLRCRPLLFGQSVETVVSADNRFIVYPNPFTNTLTIKGAFLSNRACRISLVDVLGRICIEQIFTPGTSSEIQLHTRNLHRGFYFLVLQSDTEKRIFKVEKL